MVSTRGNGELQMKKITKEERLHYFLEELTGLSERYGIVIGGCGCCGSPYLTDCSTEEDKVYADKLLCVGGNYTVIDRSE